MIRGIIVIIWGALVLIRKIPSSVSFLLGLSVVILSGVSMIFERQGFALRLTTYAFFFFVIAFISYIRELKDVKKD